MSTNDPMTEKELDAIQVRADSVTTLRTASFNDWQELALHLSEDVDALIAEVERLQARPAVTDDMVERAARAFYEYLVPGVDALLRPKWDKLVAASPDVANHYRGGVRAALNAVRGTKGES